MICTQTHTALEIALRVLDVKYTTSPRTSENVAAYKAERTAILASYSQKLRRVCVCE